MDGQFLCSWPSAYYRLTNKYTGPNKALDVINDGTSLYKIHIVDLANYSGQHWTLTPWGDGTWRLTNDFTGLEKHLDVYSDTKVGFLGTDDRTGQHWYLTRIEWWSLWEVRILFFPKIFWWNRSLMTVWYREPQKDLWQGGLARRPEGIGGFRYGR